MDVEARDGKSLVEVVENQRWWGVMWGPPMMLNLDWPGWSDAEGRSVPLMRPPTLDGQGGWFVVRTPSTDEDGWLYGTAFPRLSLPRPGGRASKRVGDNVRSRVWRRLSKDTELEPIHAECMAAAVSRARGDSHGEVAAVHPALPPTALPTIGPTAGQTLSAMTKNWIQRKLPQPSVFRLWQLLMELWNDSVSRHRMLKAVPLDPVGLFLTVKEHARTAEDLRKAALQAEHVLLYRFAQKSRLLALGPAMDDGGQNGGGGWGSSGAVPPSQPQTRQAPVAGGNPPSGGGPPADPFLQRVQVAELVADGPLCLPTTPGDRPHGDAGRLRPRPSPSVAALPDPPLPAALLPAGADPLALVQELMVIVNYTRAAYGYAMAAGHMATVGTFLHMVGTAAFFDPVAGASVEANNEAIHTLTGIPQSDILLAEWRNTTFRPCHFLALDRARGRLVLCVRGSLELGDICTDLAARPVEVEFGGGLGKCHVHQGLLSAALHVEQSTRVALQDAARLYPDTPLLVTGHSLGGGVSALLAIMLEHGFGPGAAPSAWAGRCHCVAVACPPAVSLHVADACAGIITTLAHQLDFVTRLSQYSVECILMDLIRNSPAAQLADNLSAGLAAMAQGLPWAGSGGSSGGGDDQGGSDAAGSGAGSGPGSGDFPQAHPLADGSAGSPAGQLEVEMMTQRSAFTALSQWGRDRGGSAASKARASTTPPSQASAPLAMTRTASGGADAAAVTRDVQTAPSSPRTPQRSSGGQAGELPLMDCWSGMVESVKSDLSAVSQALSVTGGPRPSAQPAPSGTTRPLGSSSSSAASPAAARKSVVSTAARAGHGAPSQGSHAVSHPLVDADGKPLGQALPSVPHYSAPSDPDTGPNLPLPLPRPPSLDAVVGQVMDDVAPVAASPRSSPLAGRTSGASENSAKQEVMHRIHAAKLYLPGRVLWVVGVEAAHAESRAAAAAGTEASADASASAASDAGATAVRGGGPDGERMAAQPGAHSRSAGRAAGRNPPNEVFLDLALTQDYLPLAPSEYQEIPDDPDSATEVGPSQAATTPQTAVPGAEAIDVAGTTGNAATSTAEQPASCSGANAAPARSTGGGSTKPGDGGSLPARLAQGLKVLKQSIEAALGQGGGEDADDGRDAQHALCLLEADRQLFERLYLVPSCAGDHIPDAYYSTLVRLQDSLLMRMMLGPPAA